jgi:ligand-binding sensor domain-containing protein
MKRQGKHGVVIITIFLVLIIFASCKDGKIVTEISKDVTSILQDKNGNYWFGSYDDGVYRYDGKELVQFTIEDGLSNNQVRTIQEDEAGQIWFVTGGGICNYNGESFIEFEDTYERRKLINQVNNSENKSKKILFEAGIGAYVYYGDSTIYVSLPKSELDAPFINNLSDRSNPYLVYCSLKDKKGNLWFGTQSFGVCCYNGESFTYFTSENSDGFAVRTIFEDRKGNIWFGNNGGGLFRIDNDTVRNIKNEFNLDHTNNKLKDLKLDSNLKSVWAINEDSNGNLWIGTLDSGIWKYDGKVFTSYTMKDGLTSNSIICIYKDKKGVLWVGTSGGGLCKLNGERFEKFVLSKAN